MLALSFLMAVLFLFGFFLRYETTVINQVEIPDYEAQCSETAVDGVCLLKFTVTESLNKPFIYYKLQDFYANHRSFVKSRSYDQQFGKDVPADKLQKCDPVLRVSDLEDFVGPLPLPQDQVANPCGLVAKYKFTDEYLYV